MPLARLPRGGVAARALFPSAGLRRVHSLPDLGGLRRDPVQPVLRLTHGLGQRGIRIGEPDKNNAGPTGVQIHGASLFGNVGTYVDTSTPPAPPSAYGDLINYTQAAIDATGNWWGVATGPIITGAGMASIALLSTGHTAESVSAARLIVRSLADLSPATIAQLIRRHASR